VQNLKTTAVIKADNVFQLFVDNDDVRKNRKERFFIPYASRYSGGFALLDTMKIPRPCAAKSFNLTALDYWRGQNTVTFSMSNNSTLTSAIGLFDQANTKVIF
jgi:hypothetical protein